MPCRRILHHFVIVCDEREVKVVEVKMSKRGGARLCGLRLIPVLLHDTTIHFESDRSLVGYIYRVRFEIRGATL